MFENKTSLGDFIVRNQFTLMCFLTFIIGFIVGDKAKATLSLESQESLGSLVHIIMVPYGVNAAIGILLNIVLGLGNLGDLTNKVLLATLFYFAVTNLAASAIGFGLVWILAPPSGKAHNLNITLSAMDDLYIDLLKNMIPKNFSRAFVETGMTFIINRTINETTGEYQIEEFFDFLPGANTLAIIMTSIVFGMAIKDIGSNNRHIRSLLLKSRELLRSYVRMLAWYLPLINLFMTASSFSVYWDWDMVRRNGVNIIVCILGEFIHGLIILPLFHVLVVRTNPFKVIRAVSEPLSIAFACSSSASTSCYTSMSLRGIGHKKINGFVLPLGTTFNMNGTTLYLVAVVTEIAMSNDVKLSLLDFLILWVAAALISTIASGAPETGSDTAKRTLRIVGLPPTDVREVEPVVWLLDRANTVVNVLGDCFGVAILSHVFREELEEPERQLLEERSIAPMGRFSSSEELFDLPDEGLASVTWARMVNALIEEEQNEDF